MWEPNVVVVHLHFLVWGEEITESVHLRKSMFSLFYEKKRIKHA